MSEPGFCYVASLGCGCGVAICFDDGNWHEDVTRWRDEGYRVERLSSEQALESFQARCDRYPHTAWQRRNEQAREKRLQTLKL